MTNMCNSSPDFEHIIDMGEQLLYAVRCIDNFDWLGWRDPISEEIIEATCQAMILLARLLLNMYSEIAQGTADEKGCDSNSYRRILVSTFSYWFESLIAVVFYHLNVKGTPRSLRLTRLNFTIFTITEL